MKRIGDLLGKFTKITQDSDSVRVTIAAALASVKILIDIDKVKIQGSVVTLQLSASQKSEVFLKQKKIIMLLSENQLTKKITLVR